jgi:uncharacterized repeat protein (TIGR01451 family)
VPISQANGSPFLNTAQAEASNANPVYDSHILPVQSAPVLNLQKAAPNSAQAGDNIQYTLQYSNTGNAIAQAVRLEDVLPAGTSFVSADNGGTESGGVVRWIIGDIPAGGSGSVSIELQADLGLADGVKLQNAASISAVNGQPVSASAITVIRSHVELDVTISGSPDPVAPGDQAAFLVSYANIGNQSSANTEVRATLPANVQFAAATGGGVYDAVTNSVVWAAGSLPPGPYASVNFLVNVDSSATPGSLLTSTVSATDSLAQPVSALASIKVLGSPPVPQLPLQDIPAMGMLANLLLILLISGFAMRRSVAFRRY